MPHLQSMNIGGDEFFFALELLADQIFQDRKINIEKRGQRPHVNDVLEQLPLTRVGVFAQTHLRQWNAKIMNVAAHVTQVEGFGGVIEHVATGLHLADVFRKALRVHADHHVDAAAAAQIAVLADAHFVPGGQSLNIRGENVSWAHRDTHAENRLGKHAIGTGGAGAIDVGELDDEVVDGFFWLHR